MQSDHRAIQLTLPGDYTGKTKKRWTPPAKRDINDPKALGEEAESSIGKTPSDRASAI